MNALAGSKIQSEKLIAAMLPSYHKYTNANSRIPCKAQTHMPNELTDSRLTIKAFKLKLKTLFPNLFLIININP